MSIQGLGSKFGPPRFIESSLARRTNDFLSHRIQGPQEIYDISLCYISIQYHTYIRTRPLYNPADALAKMGRQQQSILEVYDVCLSSVYI